MRFNINDKVRVKLNERGHEIMRRRHQAYVRLLPGGFGVFTPKAADAYGWSEWQLWDLMNTFGSELLLGNQPPFETVIEMCVDAVPQSGKGRLDYAALSYMIENPSAWDTEFNQRASDLMAAARNEIILLRTTLSDLLGCLDAESAGVAMQVTKPERIAAARAAVEICSRHEGL